MTNVRAKGCITHRVKSFRKSFDGHIAYTTLCNKEKGDWHNFIVDTPVTCVSCNNRLSRIADTKAAVAAHAEGEPLNILLKPSFLVHRVEEYHILEHDVVFKSICGHWMGERGKWKTPVVVNRPVTCKHCLRVLKAREKMKVTATEKLCERRGI